MYIDRRRQRPSARRPEAMSGCRACAATARKVAHGNHEDDVIKFTGARRRRRDEMLNGAQYIRAISRRCIHGNRAGPAAALYAVERRPIPVLPSPHTITFPPGSVLIQPQRNRLLITRRVPFAVAAACSPFAVHDEKTVWL